MMHGVTNIKFTVFFVCICVLYYCHRVATQWQLNISYHILLALQSTVSFSLLNKSLPFCPFFTFLSSPSYSHYLHIFFDIYSPSLPLFPSNSRTYKFAFYYPKKY
jgi:hypothetical protein